MIFLQGSPELKEVNGIKTGRLSGIVAHHIPNYLQKNRLPSAETTSKTFPFFWENATVEINSNKKVNILISPA